MNWWQYLLLVNLYLVLFYGFYALLLRKETFFQLNRVYLVSSAMLSFFIPLIQAGWVQQLFITQKVEYTIYSDAVTINSFKPVEIARVNFGELFSYLYLAGIAFLVIRLTIQLLKLNKIIRMPEHGAAYSFFRKIKLDMAFNSNGAIAAHEQVHAKQWHSADVMIMEAVMVINWFNPVVYFYRRAIKHIHEFIADSRAVKTAANKSEYALLLMSQTFNVPQHNLVNHFFNGSLLKQRIIMLQKNKSHRVSLLKYGLSAPLFMLMLVLSSATVNNSAAIRKVNDVAKNVFLQPVSPSVILQMPAIIKHANVIDTEQTFSAIKQTANSKLTSTNTDTIIFTDKVDSTHTVLFSGNKLNGSIVKDYGNLTFSSNKLNGLTESHNSSFTTQSSPMPVGREIYPDTTQDNVVFSSVEIQPQNPGFGEFLAKNIRYPADARAQKIEGKVIVGFVIQKDGSVTNVRLVHSSDDRFDAEAIRVVSSSPKWTPGYQNGKAVNVQYTVPIIFSLGNNSTPGFTVAATSDTTGKVFRLTFSPSLPEALIILDGKEIDYNTFKSLDANNIKSINILKDKSATALYGTRGAHGVIVIKTKD